MRKFSSGSIQNEELTIISEHPSSADQFERKPQANMSPSDKSFEKQEEEMIGFKEEQHDELINYSLIDSKE